MLAQSWVVFRHRSGDSFTHPVPQVIDALPRGSGETDRRIRAVVDRVGHDRCSITCRASVPAITVAPHTTQLTAQEAADVIDISRPTLIRLLREGEIAYEQRGRHRRVRLADVLEYQDRSRQERRTALVEMSHAAAQDGTAGSRDEFVRTR